MDGYFYNFEMEKFFYKKQLKSHKELVIKLLKTSLLSEKHTSIKKTFKR